MDHLIRSLFALLLSLLNVYAYEVVECYWAADQELPRGASGSVTSDTYIPCGEVSQGVQSCCRVGHNCLEANACYAPEAGMVYTAGCTDPNYVSSQCPTKCQTSSYWVGHSYCNGTSNQWSCCANQHGDQSNGEPYPFNNNQPCWCPEEDAVIAFAAPSVIPSVAYLDLGHPGSISYFPGHTPSTVQDDSSTTTTTATTSSRADPSITSMTTTSQRTQSMSSPSAQTNSPTSDTASRSAVSGPVSTAAPSTAFSAPSSDPSLPTGAKVGIGIGVGAGAIVLAGLVWLVVSHLRRRRRAAPPPIEDQIRPKSFGSCAGLSEAKSPTSAGGDLRSPTWSGHRSELPADENAVVSPTVPASSTNSMAMAEVEGSTPRQSVQSQPSVNANGIRQYIPYSAVARGRSTQSMQNIHEMPG